MFCSFQKNFPFAQRDIYGTIQWEQCTVMWRIQNCLWKQMKKQAQTWRHCWSRYPIAMSAIRKSSLCMWQGLMVENAVTIGLPALKTIEAGRLKLKLRGNPSWNVFYITYKSVHIQLENVSYTLNFEVYYVCLLIINEIHRIVDPIVYKRKYI